MKASVPSMVNPPPLTGASRNVLPRLATRRGRAQRRAIVDESMINSRAAWL
jgi:hypothetical protein